MLCLHVVYIICSAHVDCSMYGHFVSFKRYTGDRISHLFDRTMALQFAQATSMTVVSTWHARVKWTTWVLC